MDDGRRRAHLLAAFARFGPAWVRFLRGSVPDSSPARLRLLGALQQADGPVIMRDLSRRLDLTPRAVTALVDGLEADALVERRPHPRDRRATVVALTDEGRTRAGALWSGHLSRADDVLGVLSDDDAEHLARILGLLTAELHRREPPAGGAPPAC